MRIICISDTHNRHAQISVPAGDVLLHAGDLTMYGSLPEIEAVFSWLSRLPHQRIIVTPGNHDFSFEQPMVTDYLRKRFPRVEVLIDAATTVGGFRVWGAPWQPRFHNWAFNLPRGGNAIASKWALIPSDTAILFTHGPPFGILDVNGRREHVGCTKLTERIKQLPRLQLGVFGHVHEAYGSTQKGDVIYINASICDRRYSVAHAPIVVDVKR